jgi:type I restriction enzyme S subunit
MGPDGWRVVRVADLVADGSLAINDGYRVRNTELGPVGTPFVRGGDIGDGWISTDVADHIRPEFQDRVTGKLTREGDIAFITKGTVGRVGYLRADQPAVVFAPQVCYWRVNDSGILDQRYLYFLLNGPEFQANLDAVKTHGSMVADYVSLSDQRQFRLRLPRIETQRAIGCILGSLDDKIELNRRTNETLEAMSRTLFRSWFVDFDPVCAKADGQTPPNLDAATAKLFPNSFESSVLGLIPKGWRVKPIGEIVEVIGGSTPSTDEPSYWNGQHHFATPKDMAALSSPVLLTTERTITAAGLERISSGLLPAGTVLMSSRAPIGYLAITEMPVAVNQGFIAMKCPDGMPNHYVLHWARQNMDEIIAHANGTTFLEISKTNFRPLKALVPDAKVLKAFAALVSPLHQRVVANLRESDTLAATRDTLLPKLLSGEVKAQ